MVTLMSRLTSYRPSLYMSVFSWTGTHVYRLKTKFHGSRGPAPTTEETSETLPHRTDSRTFLTIYPNSDNLSEFKVGAPTSIRDVV